MNFSYRRIDLADPFSKKPYILRPIIPVSLRYKNHSLRFEALIDSGADFNIFPMEIARKLNIPVSRAKKIYFSEIGGGLIEGVVAEILIGIGESEIKTKAVFTDAKENTGILGQKGFFDHFDVMISHRKQTLQVALKLL